MAESTKSIYGALIANAAIAVIKFIAAYISGSSAMLSEGIHSVVDTCNELLLLLGIRRSKLPPDKDHPFGHGKEIYFWSLIVAVLVFGIGGGMSIYEGITHISNPHPIENAFWSYLVLGGAFIFEAISFYISIKGFLKQPHQQVSFWKKLRSSKDPGFFLVIYEDAADLAGLLIAFAGIILSHSYDNPLLDGMASILIGLVLTFTAILMIIESHDLLIGESAKGMVIEETEKILKNDEDVYDVGTPLTMQLSPDEVLLVLNLEFKKDLNRQQVTAGIIRLKSLIQKRFPQIKQIYLNAGKLAKQTREE